MIVKLRKIGNSSGILLSKSLLEQCCIKEEVEVTVKDGAIVIAPVIKIARDGWEQQFLKAAANDHEDLMGSFQNKFDAEEWTW
ncbi:MAG: AbrB/MazE/SpoVT family DNA-binding domain-containing protein [Chitinophagaceae bacterium]